MEDYLQCVVKMYSKGNVFNPMLKFLVIGELLTADWIYVYVNQGNVRPQHWTFWQTSFEMTYYRLFCQYLKSFCFITIGSLKSPAFLCWEQLLRVWNNCLHCLLACLCLSEHIQIQNERAEKMCEVVESSALVWCLIIIRYLIGYWFESLNVN